MRNLSKRIAYGLLTFALLVVLMAPGVMAQRTTIVFWHAMSGALGEHTQYLVDQFNASQDEFFVEATYRGSYEETMVAAVAATRAGNPPHIVQVYEVGTRQMLDSGVIYPVYQLMADYGFDIDWDDFIGPVRGYYEFEGNLYSMPFNSSSPILYYNKDAFRAAGLDPEKPPTTWQEVEEYSRAILEAGATRYGFSSNWPSWIMMENMHAWHNQPFATLSNGFDGLGVELLINGEFGLMHVSKLAEWHREGIYQYGGRGSGASPMFSNGDVAMFIESSAGIAGFRNTANFDWGTSTLPHWGEPYEKVNSIIGGATLWAMRGHDDAGNRGIAEFFKFLASTENQAWWHMNTGYVPITLSAMEMLEADGHFERQPEQRTALLQLTNAEPQANTRGVRLGTFVQVRDIIESQLENIFAGLVTPEQGLNEAVRQANQTLRDYQMIYE